MQAPRSVESFPFDTDADATPTPLGLVTTSDLCDFASTRCAELSGQEHEAKVKEKLRAYAAGMPTVDTFTTQIIAAQQWNLACAQAAQESAYRFQYVQALMQRQCMDEACASNEKMLKAVKASPPAPAFCNGSREIQEVVPTRPPGVWHTQARAPSCSSIASTCLSSDLNDKLVRDCEHERSSFSIRLDLGLRNGLKVETPDAASLFRDGIRVTWPIDERKLRSGDIQIVSPSFELSPGSEFKMVIRAGSKGEKRGQTGFKATKGRGSIELKCINMSKLVNPPLTFRISLCVPNGNSQTHGLVTHDFIQEALYGVAHDDRMWDFRAAVDVDSKAFVVCLEVVSA